jgi:hypothetical protein
MRNLTSTLGRLAVVLSGALALGSCSRSNYAFLPKADSYLGTTTAAPKARHTAPVAVAQAPVVATAPVTEAPTTIAAAPAVAAPVAAAKTVEAPAKVAVAPATEAAAVAEAPAAATVAAQAPQKLNLLQRMALAKVTKKLNKLADKSSQFKQGDNTAHTARISGNLRTGLILLLIGLIVGIFSGLIGTIIALIGVIFLVLWLLDEL